MIDTPQTPVRAVTRGPKYHWFGYYDKFQFDVTNRYILGMETEFENRTPTPDDEIRIGMIDLEDGNAWTDFDKTTAWCWQQGCMLQWRPGHDDEIVWNDRADGKYISHVLNIKTGAKRTLPMPIYSISPDGKTAVVPDYPRITRPGYGYIGIEDPREDVPAPEDAGIWRMDMDTGEYELIITFAEVAAIPCEYNDKPLSKNYFNHLLWNTDGTRFCFLNRDGWFFTRLVTASPDGSDIRMVEDYGGASHFIWRDPEHILCWSYRHPSEKAGYYLYHDGDEEDVLIGEGKMVENGHCTYLADTDWVLTDTYCGAEDRRQELFLYHVPSDRKVTLGYFPSPEGYDDEWRCDLHPRASRDGRCVVFDSPHGGEGRQLYLCEIESIVS